MKKYFIFLSLLIITSATAWAERIPGGLYDKNGKLIKEGFVPEDMSREDLKKLRSKRPLTKEEGDALAEKNRKIITGDVPGDPPNMPYRFGTKPLPPTGPVFKAGDPLPASYKPAFGTYGVTRKFGDPNEAPNAFTGKRY